MSCLINVVCVYCFDLFLGTLEFTVIQLKINTYSNIHGDNFYESTCFLDINVYTTENHVKQC